MISALSPNEALTRLSRAVLPWQEPSGLASELLAQLALRALSFMAPCTAHELVKVIGQSFSGSDFCDDDLVRRIEHVVEDLIVYGDILEMRHHEGGAWIDKSKFVLLPAPPSFVLRHDRSIVILGIAGEEISALTAEQESRVQYRGVLRTLPFDANDDVAAHLVELGLLRLSEKSWLRLPDSQTAAAHVAGWQNRLAGQPPSMPVDDLQIIDTERSPTFYRDRWCSPTNQTGLHIGRRPQRYGAALWCLTKFRDGSLQRYLDLTAVGDRMRPVDVAWRLQAALDALEGVPQVFRSSLSGSGTCVLRFYSPVPSWCERRLAIAGEKVKADRCLFSYEIPIDQLPDQLAFLRETLWMAEITD